MNQVGLAEVSTDTAPTATSESAGDGPMRTSHRPSIDRLRLRVTSLAPWIPFAALALISYMYRDGGEAIVRQHDQLDYFVAVFANVSLTDLFSSIDHVIEEPLGGLSREFLGSEFHVGNITFALLPTMWALLVTELIVRTIAYVGFRLLVRELGFRGVLVEVGVPTLYSLLPFWLPGFGAVAGLPLLMWAFVAVARAGRVTRGAVVVAAGFPLYSALAFNVPYATMLIGASLVGGLVTKRAVLQPLIRLWIVFVVASVVTGWRFIASALFGAESHRQDMVSDRPWTLSMFDGVLGELLDEDVHAAAGRSWVLWSFIVAGLLLLVAHRRAGEPRVRLIAAFAAAGVIVAALMSRLWIVVEANVIASVFEGWGRLQMSRLTWFEPVLLALLLVVALTVLASSAASDSSRRSVVVRSAFGLLLGVQALLIVDMHQFRTAPESPSVAEYYLVNEFAAVHARLEADGYDRVATVGFHPAVPIFHGVRSADGYWTGYPIEYKSRFRRLIAPSLDANPADAGYYDRWGSRVYVFQAGLGRQPCCRLPSEEPIDLLVDATQFQPLQISHVISSAPFLNAGQVGLRLVEQFAATVDSGPSVWLYAVDGRVGG